MTAIIPPIKRGDTFMLSCTYAQAGVPTDLTAYTIRSQVRKTSDDTLVEELVVVKANQTTDPGEFTIAAASPQNWPVGMLSCDIQFTEASSVRSSQTFLIPVEKDRTYD